MKERIIRIGIPVIFAVEMEKREENLDPMGVMLDDAAVREVVSVLMKAGGIEGDDHLRVEFCPNPAVGPEDRVRPIWVSEVVAGDYKGEEVEENIKEYAYHAAAFENNN